MLKVFVQHGEEGLTVRINKIVSYLFLFFSFFFKQNRKKKEEKRVILLALCGLMLQRNYLSHLPQLFSYLASCHSTNSKHQDGSRYILEKKKRIKKPPI
jgi:hypothetical protein